MPGFTSIVCTELSGSQWIELPCLGRPTQSELALERKAEQDQTKTKYEE
jgi:hypothetical protein